MWTDKELKLKLLRRGILTRIYAPMVCKNFEFLASLLIFVIDYFVDDMTFSFLCSQVIIQGLRDSGLFGSVIQSAQTTPSKDVKSSNTSRVDKPGMISSRKIGVKETTATARRILEIPNETSYNSAIPPLSPPILDDLYIEI